MIGLRSIRSKVLASILLVTLLTSAIVSLLFYQKAAVVIQEDYTYSLKTRGSQLAEELDAMLQRLYKININVSCDRDLKRGLIQYQEDSQESQLENLADRLKTYRGREEAMDSLYLLIPDKGLCITSEDYPTYEKGLSKERITQMAKNARKSSGPFLVRDMMEPNTWMLTFGEAVYDTKGKILGYVFINVEERYLRYQYMHPLEDAAMKDIFLLDKEGRILTGSNGKQVGQEGKPEQKGADGKIISLNCNLLFAQWDLWLFAKQDAVLEDLLSMRKYVVAIWAVLLCLSLVPAFYLTRAIYRPLEKLTEAMAEVTEGGLRTRAEIVSKDEISALAMDFNHMLDQIEELIQQVIHQEKLKKDAELEALQYQITPHFMYNTLNSIKYAALIKGEKELGDIIGDFVGLLQASISKQGAFVTVEDELYLVKRYIRLQEFRYGETFEGNYFVQEDAKQCQVPRLLLQPLVENAMLHGIDLKTKKGRLEIRAEQNQNILSLTVSDNGRGMTKDQIEKLLNSEEKKTKGFTAVGVPNIRQRLALYYGTKADLTYTSDENGTAACIHMPAIKEEGGDEYEENNDCR